MYIKARPHRCGVSYLHSLRCLPLWERADTSGIIMHIGEASRGHLSMSESVTLLPRPKDIKIGVGAAFIKAHGAMLL